MLLENFFLFPVRVVVGGDLVYEGQTAIIHVASTGLWTLNRLRKTQRLRMPHDGGDILFTKIDGEIQVSGDDGTGQASYEEIHDAWLAFSANVAHFLLEHFPQLRTHRKFKRWFDRVLAAKE